MLRGIDPLISADLLHVLGAMGHGDELAIVDANFPAATMARQLVRLDGSDASRALKAILTLLPLDDFVDAPATAMQVVGDPDAIPQIVREFQEIVNDAEKHDVKMMRIDRFDFYARAREAFAIVATGETRLYGCVLVRKGVLRP